jgi:hypothetical protein
VKKIDYYAVQNPWRMPKWLGVVLGGVFGVIAVGSVAVIVHLTRSTPPMTALAAAPVAAPTAAAAPAAAPAAAAAPVASADDDAAPAAKKASKHHSSHNKAMKVASAKRASTAPTASAADAKQRATILAKHDTKEKRREKDALDKLLGL